MKLYDFVTPSDPITFKAENDKVAFWVAVYVGKGKAGCSDEQGNKLETMLMFYKDLEKIIIEKLECSMNDFFESNKTAIADCLLSFAYGDFNSRKEYDLAVESITDLEKLKAFKKAHDDLRRSSMSEWCNYAWGLGEKIKRDMAKTGKVQA